jgi:uncharacterized protein
MRIGLGSDSDAFEISLFIIGAFGPTVAALATQWLSHRDARIYRFRTGLRPMFAGLALGSAGFFIATVVGPALSLAKAPLHDLNWSPLLHWSTYAVNYSTFLGGPVNEEPGWRGFALPRLQARFGPYLATVILAPLWAAWHIPMFWVEGWTTVNPWQFVLILLGASFLLTAAANLSRFNILVAILLHALFNTSPALLNALTHNLPPRPYTQTNYSLTVLALGTAIGAAALLVRARGAQVPEGLISREFRNEMPA